MIVSVSTMLERLAKLNDSAEGKKALALLESRAFTAEARKPAEDTLASLRKLGKAEIPELDPAAKVEQEKALAEAWAWYREWSTIARTLFSRGDILIQLGLRKPKRGGADEEDEDEPSPGDPTPQS